MDQVVHVLGAGVVQVVHVLGAGVVDQVSCTCVGS